MRITTALSTKMIWIYGKRSKPMPFRTALSAVMARVSRAKSATPGAVGPITQNATMVLGNARRPRALIRTHAAALVAYGRARRIAPVL